MEQPVKENVADLFGQLLLWEDKQKEYLAKGDIYSFDSDKIYLIFDLKEALLERSESDEGEIFLFDGKTHYLTEYDFTSEISPIIRFFPIELIDLSKQTTHTS